MKNPGICVILNIGSGKPDAKSQPDSIREAFASHGAEITLKIIRKGSRLQAETTKAVQEGFKTIVAAGGDGTICGVASILNGSPVVMGILPLGTFNYFARSLDLPLDITEAAGVIVKGHSMPLRIGMVNDSMFLNNASLGAYPAILATREKIYRRWGRSRVAAYWAVIKTLASARRSMRLRLTVDGKSRDVRAPLVFVVNNAYQLEQMNLDGADKIKVGEMALFIAPDATRFGIMRHAVAVATGLASADRNFELVGGKEIDIQNLDRPTRGKRTIAKDGERERIAGPYRFRIVQDGLRVLVPSGRTVEVR